MSVFQMYCGETLRNYRRSVVFPAKLPRVYERAHGAFDVCLSSTLVAIIARSVMSRAPKSVIETREGGYHGIRGPRREQRLCIVEFL